MDSIQQNDSFTIRENLYTLVKEIERHAQYLSNLPDLQTLGIMFPKIRSYISNNLELQRELMISHKFIEEINKDYNYLSIPDLFINHNQYQPYHQQHQQQYNNNNTNKTITHHPSPSSSSSSSLPPPSPFKSTSTSSTSSTSTTTTNSSTDPQLNVNQKRVYSEPTGYVEPQTFKRLNTTTTTTNSPPPPPQQEQQLFTPQKKKTTTQIPSSPTVITPLPIVASPSSSSSAATTTTTSTTTTTTTPPVRDENYIPSNDDPDFYGERIGNEYIDEPTLDQKNRIARALREDIKLEQTFLPDYVQSTQGFKIVGSTSNYDVKIATVPHCTCQDFGKHRFCKHLLFVLLKVLGLSLNSYILYQLAYTKAEVKYLLSLNLNVFRFCSNTYKNSTNDVLDIEVDMENLPYWFDPGTLQPKGKSKKNQVVSDTTHILNDPSQPPPSTISPTKKTTTSSSSTTTATTIDSTTIDKTKDTENEKKKTKDQNNSNQNNSNNDSSSSSSNNIKPIFNISENIRLMVDAAKRQRENTMNQIYSQTSQASLSKYQSNPSHSPPPRTPLTVVNNNNGNNNQKNNSTSPISSTPNDNGGKPNVNTKVQAYVNEIRQTLHDAEPNADVGLVLHEFAISRSVDLKSTGKGITPIVYRFDLNGNWRMAITVSNIRIRQVVVYYVFQSDHNNQDPHYRTLINEAQNGRFEFPNTVVTQGFEALPKTNSSSISHSSNVVITNRHRYQNGIRLNQDDRDDDHQNNNINHIKQLSKNVNESSSSSDDNQETYFLIYSLIERVIGYKQLPFIKLELANTSSSGVGGEYFYLLTRTLDNVTYIYLQANNAVNLAQAFNYYLKYYAMCVYTWTGDQCNLGDGRSLPEMPVPVTIPIASDLRYYMNVVTFGYSTVWWDWERWQREIDWMALNGYNLPLAFVGQEYVWFAVYSELGVSPKDIESFFSGGAFLPWNRMGNVNGWGGPLDYDFIAGQHDLQQQILERMRQYGMKPVLPGFAGHVPRAFMSLFPTANITQLGDWRAFNGTYYLDPSDPLFANVSQTFVKVQTAIYGTDHYYSFDPFNEITPPSSDAGYLQNSSSSMYNALAYADPQAVWVLQAWFFISDAWFWQPPQVKAFLGGVPIGHLLVLDTWAEESPAWTVTDQFNGHDWIWCMLHNFGGRTGMYGKIPRITAGPIDARKQSPGMKGTGLTPEAIEQNYIMYDLMSEMSWRTTAPNMTEWINQYTQRRYGVFVPELAQAWNSLASTVYNAPDSIDKNPSSFVGIRPELNMTNNIYYDSSIIQKAWQLYLSVTDEYVLSTSTYSFDIAEITIQALSNLFIETEIAMYDAYKTGKGTEFDEHAMNCLNIITDMDMIASTQQLLLVGTWTANARQWANYNLSRNKDEDRNTDKEQMTIEQYEFNARNQITLWGPSNSTLHDYAYHLWSGLLNDFYLARWSLFIKYLDSSLSSSSTNDAGTGFKNQEYINDIESLEESWNLQTYQYPTRPTGNAYQLSKFINNQPIIPKIK
ncbi:alpha-N-acetylglucosaminidase [Cavenderia fasciculata]|uniref:Alpha-N-acetylglucosaminidase n=1 Tax=Cavenderia fasciculata TaxID=261658 RepID=F4Q7P3_CACFS|nr:alpha-N-acetylglucosaminidase [Cavenderia fasciculata]EGG15793.1 alpha-N-acetylglucosaminidase [Cavenderia fasciculata]|eukprot:XP_004352118.1 alpha-N-acetylglucosaminidase [Cavenderia fasciculata]